MSGSPGVYATEVVIFGGGVWPTPAAAEAEHSRLGLTDDAVAAAS